MLSAKKDYFKWSIIVGMVGVGRLFPALLAGESFNITFFNCLIDDTSSLSFFLTRCLDPIEYTSSCFPVGIILRFKVTHHQEVLVTNSQVFRCLGCGLPANETFVHSDIIISGLSTGGKEMNDDQLPLPLPLDERYRQAEQYQLELPPPAPKQPRAEVEVGCPHHRIFVYGCRYCDPR